MDRADVLNLVDVPEEKVFNITFGQRWRTERHPAGEWIDPSGYVIIVADTEQQARDHANRIFGSEGWSMIYDHLDRERGRFNTTEHYPLGILAVYFV